MASHLIQGRTITMPVRVTDATVCSAMYPVRADAARAVIAYSGLDVAEVLPGKAICTLVFVEYRDSDLDSYHEFGVTFLVRPPGSPRPRTAGPATLRSAGAFVHWLPVDQGFTLEAGRTIWGFPKELADIELRLSSPYKRCILRKDGRLVIDMLVKPGLPVPGAAAPLTAYTHQDGVTRRVPARMWGSAMRVRPGGALVRLGNHPVAKELSELGLPKRALMSTTLRASMTFDAASAEDPAAG